MKRALYIMLALLVLASCQSRQDDINDLDRTHHFCGGTEYLIKREAFDKSRHTIFRYRCTVSAIGGIYGEIDDTINCFGTRNEVEKHCQFLQAWDKARRESLVESGLLKPSKEKR